MNDINLVVARFGLLTFIILGLEVLLFFLLHKKNMYSILNNPKHYIFFVAMNCVRLWFMQMVLWPLLSTHTQSSHFYVQQLLWTLKHKLLLQMCIRFYIIRIIHSMSSMCGLNRNIFAIIKTHDDDMFNFFHLYNQV